MWPSKDIDLIQKYLDSTFNMAQGHMKYIKKGPQSTNPPDMYEPYVFLNKKQKKHVCNIIEACGHIYSDQTGQLPVQSIHSYKYILIFL